MGTLCADAWLAPDHRRAAIDDVDPDSRALRPDGNDEIHAAAGAGIAFETFQVDLAVDASEPVDIASLAAICSF